MKGNVEDIFKRANFTEGSNHKEELRGKLFAEGSRTNVRPFPKYRKLSESDLVELTDGELEMIAAAGYYDEVKKDDDDLQ
ncbi:MAG: hypothetical protein E7241_04490 [Lachnospiraceae bacterium]|jgi:hypothetical protein|nr:hypothetical protein [Lachnospiraceae bacterium]